MKIEPFELERTQSLWENTVQYNLTETGIHPFSLQELLTESERAALLDLRLGYGQTNGTVALREAISRFYTGANAEQVLVTTGTIEANFLAMWRLLEPGDEIVLMHPNYMQIWGLAKSFGAKVVPLNLHEKRRWHIDTDELHRLVTPKTKMIVVCNPNNPTGSVFTEGEMQAISSAAERVGTWIYADEVYRGAEIRGEETPTFLGRYEKALVCCGLSKAYALPGLRIGWLVGPKEMIADLWAYHDYTTISPNVLSDGIATLALQEKMRKKILQRNRDYLRRNLKILSDWVETHPGLFSLIPPAAGGMAFMRYSMNVNSTEFSTQLRHLKSVFVVAGDCFGMDGFIRIGIGGESEHLKAGLNLIDEFLDQSGFLQQPILSKSS